MVNRRGSTAARTQSYGASDARRRERAARRRAADERRAQRNQELRDAGQSTAWERAQAVRRERRIPLQGKKSRSA